MQQKQRQSTRQLRRIVERLERPACGPGVDGRKGHRHVEPGPHLEVTGARRRGDRITRAQLLVGAALGRVVRHELDVGRQLADVTHDQDHDEYREQPPSCRKAINEAAHQNAEYGTAEFVSSDPTLVTPDDTDVTPL